MKIGFSTKDITPQGKVSLAGSSKERLTDKVRDPIVVTAMALEGADGVEQAVFVGCDLVGINDTVQNGIYARVAEMIPDLNPEVIIINATHTHNAPLLGEPYWEKIGFDRNSAAALTIEEYVELVISRITEAIKEAWQGRAVGSLSYEQAFAVLGHNRRALYDDGTAKMFGSVNSPHFVRLDGPEDHRVELLFAWDEHRKLTGIVINAACTSQYLSADVISADLYGEVRKQVAEKWGSRGVCDRNDRSGRRLVSNGYVQPASSEERS